MSLIVAGIYLSIKRNSHVVATPPAQVQETNQAPEIASATPEPEVATNAPPRVEAVESHDPMELALNDFGFSTNDVTPLGVTAELKEPILVNRKHK